MMNRDKVKLTKLEPKKAKVKTRKTDEDERFDTGKLRERGTAKRNN